MSTFMYKDKPLSEPGNVDFGSSDISSVGDGTVTGAIADLNTKKALNINLTTTNASDQSNAPWKVIKARHADGTLPNGVNTSGTISCGAMYSYSGFHIGSYGSWLVHCYVSGQVYHVILTGGSWKYEAITVGNTVSV